MSGDQYVCRFCGYVILPEELVGWVHQSSRSQHCDTVARPRKAPEPVLPPQPAPKLGERLYRDTRARQPVIVIAVEGTLVTYTPADAAVGSTHQGNLYDANGEHKYRVHPDGTVGPR